MEDRFERTARDVFRDALLSGSSDGVVRVIAAALRHESQPRARPADEWHDDDGDVLWWSFPITEPPYIGSPLDGEFPEGFTHWTPIVCPEAP